MEPAQFFGVIAAVLVANAATAMIAYGWIRAARENDFDWYSAGSLMTGAGIALLAFYRVA